MEKDILKLPVTMSQPIFKVDRSVKLAFTSDFEVLDERVKLDILKKAMSSGWLLYSPNPIEDQDIPEESAEVGEKSLTQRLYAVIYVLWNQKYNTPETQKEHPFQDFRRQQMEAIIEKYKEKLD